MIHSSLTSQRGFSILLALGATGVLLVIVVGLASIFLSEMRLSRLQYDSILSSTQAEGAFEYAMLKILNHKDGFADSMDSGSPDSLIFSGASARTDKVDVRYVIETQSINTAFPARVAGVDRYIVIPLFTGKCQGLLSGSNSCDPRVFSDIVPVEKIIELSTAGNANNLSWSIVAQSGSENISLAGSGSITTGFERGVMRLQGEICLDITGAKILCTLPPSGDRNPSIAEGLPYFYDLSGTPEEFLTSNSASDFKDTEVKNPYLLIFYSGADANITLKTDKPFTLPEIRVTAEAQKNDALQAIRFTEDKSKYYDAIKYGIFNTNP